jgi:sugar lactone lactonase YvrE
MTKNYFLKGRAGTLFFLIMFFCASSFAQNINTIAGIGSSSFSGDGGLAVSAELAQPVSVIRDGSGNVYISDQGNHRIRKITFSTGNISTIAGSSTSGFSGDGAAATSAKLNYPAGIAIDGSGNIYIADQGNQRIRKITAATGNISTIAGTGTAGFSGDGGAATSAQLNNPVAIALDASGNIYISDQYNQRIRKINASTGNISTIAGTGTYSYSGDGAAATSATFQNPAGIEVDASGNIYVADLFSHVIRKITASTGLISTIAGSGTAGYSGDGSAATSANLNYPTDIAIDDSGHLYISVQYSHRIRKVNAVTGNISTVIGTGTLGYSGDGGLATSAQINYPTGVTADGGGNLYVADRENHRIRFVCNYMVKPTVTSPVNYCVGVTAVALSASGTSLKWFTSPVGGVGVTTPPVPGTSSAGTTKYYVASISPYGCEGPRDSISVIVNSLPAAPVVSSPVTYCVGATATALTASGSSLKWYTTATGGTGSTTAPVPSTAAAGTTTYYVSQTSSAGCEGPRTSISVVVNSLATAPTASSPINYCEGATASALTASGTSLKWYTTSTGGTGSSTAPTPSTSTSGTTIYYVSQTTSCGESSRTAVTVNVNSKPSKPTVSTPVNYCQFATAIALTASGTSLKWYTTATGGTGSTTAPTPSTSTSGTTTYYVTQSNSTTGCESDRESISVVVTAAPAAPTVTTPVSYCIGAPASALTATGTSLTWYTTSTGGTGSSTAPTPSTITAGSTTYYVSQTSSTSGCESSRAAIVVTINALPAAPTVTSPVNLCEGISASALTASGTSLKWYTVATGGTALSGAPTPSTTATGSTTYYVSQTSAAGCEGPRASIVVNVNTTPAAPTVTTPVTYCQGATASALSATGTTLKWYSTATGGTGTTTAPTPSTATAGTVTYYVSQTNASGCESSRSAIVVTINAAPASPTVSSPVTYCVGATASALTATGSSMKWYTVATGGTALSGAPTPITTSAGTTVYYVSQTSTDGCEGARASISVIVNPLPTAPTVTTPVNYCMGATATALTATGSSLLWYTSATGGTGSATAPTPSTSSTGTTTYYVSQTTSCGESSRTAIVVNINPVPAPPTVISPLVYCQGDTGVLPLTATGTSLKWYSTRTGGTGSSTAPTPSTSTAGSTTYYVSQTNAFGCESLRDSIIVKINVAPAAPIVTSPVNYCLGATAVPLTATGTGLIWYTVPYGGVGSSTAPTPSTAVVGSTTYYVSQTDTSSCPSLRAAITVNVYSTPATPTVTTPVTYCQGATTIALSAITTTGDTLKWYTTATGGSPSLIAPTPSSATAGTTIYYVSSTSRFGCGESARASISVVINAKPSPPTVVSPVNYCVGATASALSATGTSLKWYSTLTGGGGVTSTPTPSTAIAGTSKYYVSQTVLGCESSRDSIIVNINANPAAPTVTSPVVYCVGATASALSATAGSGSSLLWYTTATGGTGSTTAPVPGTASVSTTIYYVSQVNASGCESPRAAITVNVQAAPSTPSVSSPVNYCVGATASALTATGTSLKWYTDATGGTASTTAPTPSTATSGSDTFYVSQTSSCGEGSRAAIIVNINPLPSTPVVTTPVTYCQGATASALTASGTSLKWYSTPTGGAGTTTTPTPSTATAGTVKYYVSQSSALGCEGPRDSITVTINASPLAPAVSTPVNYCVGETAAPLTATGTSLKWYTVASGGTGSATAPTPSTSTAGSTIYYVSQTNTSGCEGPRAGITVNINSLPTIPTVTSPVTYCQGSSASPLTASGTSLKWYTAATGGTGSSTAPTPSTASTGTTVYYVSQTNAAGCEGPRTSISVTINPLPAEPVVPADSINNCQGATATVLTASGTSLKWYTSATGGTATTTAPTPATTTAGVTIFYVSQTNALGCEGPRKSITVIINATPAAPSSTSPVELCSGTTASALTASGTSLKWYTTLTGGTGSATAPTPSTASTGATSYYVSQTSSNGCESPRTTINVIVYATPSAPTVGFLVTLCLGTPAGPLMATGSGLKWYTSPTGGTGSTTAPTPPTSSTGATYYYVSQTSSSGCEGPRAAILVNIDTLLSPPTVTTPVSYCQGATAVPLVASGSSLRWYAGSSTSYTTSAPTPSTSTAGTFKYYVSRVSTAGCEGYKDSITVTINPLPAAPVVTSPVNYCQNDSASALTAVGTSLKWYSTASGGTGTATAPTPVTTSTGTFTYYVSQTSSFGCEGSRASIVVIVNPLPAAPSVTSPITYCQNATASPLSASGSSLKWYTTAIGGTATTSAPTPNTTIAGTTTYYVSQTSALGCEGPRASIVVTINPLPAAPTVTSPVTYCVGETATALTASGTSLKWYTSSSGGTGSATAPTPSTTTSSTITYYVSQTSALGCEGPRDSILVIVNSVLPAPTVSSPVNYCLGATTSALTAVGSSLKWYTTATGGTATTTAPTPSSTTVGSTTYYVSQTTASGCEGLRAAIVVNINPLPTAPTVTTPVVYCMNATASALSASGSSLKWYTTASGGTGTTSAPTPITTTAGTTIYYVSQTSTDGCEGPRAAITVNINPLPSLPTVTTPVTYCEGETAVPLTATGLSLKWYTSATGGTASTSAPTPSTATAGTTKYYVSQTSALGCEGPRDSITVTVNPLPLAPTVTSPISYCVGETATALTATGISLKWYSTASGGGGITTAPTPITSSAGTVTYYVSQTTALGCEGPRASIVVTVNPLPASPTATTPVTYCQNATASALTATGTSPKWYTVSTGGTASSTAPTPSTATAGTTIYYVSQTTALGCEGPRTAITVTVNPLPSVPVVTTPVTYCVGETATALSASGISLKWYTSATGGTASTTAPIPGTTIAGTTKYYVSQTSALGCEGPRDSITVIVNSLAATPTVISPVNYCKDEIASPLTATGTSLKWYTSATGGTASTTAPTPNTATTGSVTYYVSQSSGLGCEGPRASIVVNINPLPATPIVSTPVTYCVNATASALSATGTSLKWYTSATGGTASSIAPTPVTTTAGTTKYYVSQTSALGCEGPRDSITVVVNPLPAPPIVTTPVAYCVAETASPLSATGVSLKWYTAASGGTASSTAPTPNTATSGITKYYVSQTSVLGCEGPRDSITVTVNPLPAAPTVTSPVSYCQNATATALSATGTSLKWYTSATGGTASSTAPIPNTASTGTTTYYVSQSSGLGCEGPRASIVVTINPLPSAPSVTTPVTYCVDATASALTATGSSLKWYTVATGGTASSTAPIPNTSSAGTTIYYVSQTSTDACEGPRTAISVVINPLPAVPSVTTPVTYCQDAVASALSASGTSLKWYTSAIGGTASTIAPTPVTTIAGTTKYYVSQTSALGCEGPRDSITVTINPLPTSPTVTSPVVYCQNATATALTASGVALKWYTTASGGTASTIAPTPSTLSAGSVTYYVSQTSGLGCEGPRASILVTVNPLPAAPTVTSPVTYCVDASATALMASGSSLKWYTVASGGTASATAPTPSTSIAGTTIFYVSQTSADACEGPRASITVVVNPLPAIPVVTSPVTYCQDATATALTAGGSSLKWYTTATGGTASATAPTPSTTSSGTTIYYVSQTSALGCEGPRASITVVVNPTPSAPKVDSLIGYCVGAIASPLSATGINLKWYTTASGGTASASAPTPGTAVPGITTYYVSQTSAFGCESNRASIKVEVTGKPDINITPVGAPMFVYCKNDTVTLKANSTVSISSYQWFKNGILIPGATTDLLKVYANGYYKVLVKNKYDCEKDTTVYVFGDTLPDPILSPTELLFCPNVNIVLFTTPAYPKYTYEWYKNDTLLIGAKTDKLIINKAGDYYVRVTDSFGCVSLTNNSIASTYPHVLKPTILRFDPVLRLSNTYKTYQWYRNSKIIPGANSISYTMPSYGGKFWCIVTDGNDCSETSDTADSENNTAINNNGLTTKTIKIYPNPTPSKVTIETDLKIDVRVTDAIGKLILYQKDAKEIDLEPYADAVYFFTLIDNDGQIIAVEKINKISSTR